jgi:hypothetical protein
MRAAPTSRRNLLCRVLVLGAFAQGGCRALVAPRIAYARQETYMPPNTVLLSKMMSDLSAQPGFTDQLLAAISKESKTGAAILSPKLLHALRVAIVGKDWHGLDHFPGWTMQAIDPAVETVDNVAAKFDRPAASIAPQPITSYIDLGPYALNHPQTIDLNQPSTLPGFTTEGLVEPLGENVVRGDAANPAIAPMHSESSRLAYVLNRLSLNRLAGSATATATLGANSSRTPEDLLRALIASGHQVTVADARYFANFGHLHYKGADVMMPFWVNAQVTIPGTRRQLLVPVAHAEYEWLIRGPKINADVSFYFGVDGKAEFRTMDTQDQAWVMGRHAHQYQGADAVEVTRLTGLLVLAYAHQHLARPQLPFGGYYTLGVCQDGIAAIERKMTGKATLFPNTADMSLFQDPRDVEINGLLATIPKDRSGQPPQLQRIFGSLPTTDLAAITIPGLADDLESVQQAWHDGKLQRNPRPRWSTLLICGSAAVGALLLGALAIRLRRTRTQPRA